MDLLTQAKAFATRKHVLDNQQLYGHVLPYTHHLQDVERVLIRFDITHEVMLTAAWLHDLVEDTAGRHNEVRARDVEELFGEDVAKLVAAVTSEPGPNRKTRNPLTYPKIRAAGQDAVALKLADRIANIEFGGRASKMYRDEYKDFCHGLHGGELETRLYAGAPSVEDMWACLDALMRAR